MGREPAGSLAVVLPAWRDASELPQTIAALDSCSTTFSRVQLVVVAGGDLETVHAAEAALARHPRLGGAVVRQRPRGKMAALADGMSALVSAEPPDWVLLLDADTRLLPGALGRAVQFLRLHPDLAGVGPQLVLRPDGIGAAHDLVQRGQLLGCGRRTSVSGGATLVRGSRLWPHWQQVFAEHDYPIHIDYQVCERLVAATGLHFALAPGFLVDTPRGRGWAFVRAERRHHRAMFARRGTWAARRYLMGSLATALSPSAPLVVACSAPMPILWPVAGGMAAIALHRLRRFRRQYQAAAQRDEQVRSTSFRQYVRDEWVFSLSAVAGAVDAATERKPRLVFRGVRRASARASG